MEAVTRYEHMTIVDVGDGAQMTMPAGELNWKARYAPASAHLIIADCLESYSYLLSKNISTKEAIRRLRLLRGAITEGGKHE